MRDARDQCFASGRGRVHLRSFAVVRPKTVRMIREIFAFARGYQSQQRIQT
nr:hypothetical protein [Mycobacterium pseudoshottsii]